VLLNSLYWRPANRTDEFSTLRTVTGKRFGATKPVYVLTSSRTFSAAEEFAYDLQSRKRAVIVGETTGGGAHPGGVTRVEDDFAVFVPSGRAINPVTGTNWEGTGVRPEIAVVADSAIAAALSDARKRKGT
jgi:C-terminal processing protease CtpA/Prc